MSIANVAGAYQAGLDTPTGAGAIAGQLNTLSDHYQKKHEEELKAHTAQLLENLKTTNEGKLQTDKFAQESSMEDKKIAAAERRQKIAAGLNPDTNSIQKGGITYIRNQLRADSSSMKKNTEQDRIENQAINRLSSIRGDTSVARIESQRDASIQAYTLIDEIKAEGRLPSQIEYYDILGQLWKARTGAAPTDQAIRDLDAKTFKGNLAKAAQYITGKPMGITTKEVLENIQSFADKSGKQSDALHEGYMKTHLIKPSGLDEERWNNIKNNTRGLSYSDAIKQRKESVAGGVGQQTQQASSPNINEENIQHTLKLHPEYTREQLLKKLGTK